GLARIGREGVPRHVRLQPQGNERLPGPIRPIAVSELPRAAGKGASEMARGRDGVARPRSRMVLLPADGQGNTRLSCDENEPQNVAGAGVHPAGTNSRAVRLVLRCKIATRIQASAR